MCQVFSKVPGKDWALNKHLWNITEQFTDSTIDTILGDWVTHVSSSFTCTQPSYFYFHQGSSSELQTQITTYLTSQVRRSPWHLKLDQHSPNKTPQFRPLPSGSFSSVLLPLRLIASGQVFRMKTWMPPLTSHHPLFPGDLCLLDLSLVQLLYSISPKPTCQHLLPDWYNLGPVSVLLLLDSILSLRQE